MPTKAKTHPTELPPVYSFDRYSDPSQGDGDSTRRQRSAAAAWCKKNNRVLDRTLSHVGSAYRGKQRKSGTPLAQFKDDVETGVIPTGAVLLLENMDRLSREKPVAAVNYLTSILLGGVRIVRLEPGELELDEDSDLFTLLRGQLEQERGHNESKSKSARLAAVWGAKQDKARADKSVQTSRVPAWLDVVGRRRVGNHMVGGELLINPAKAQIVKQIFQWVIAGMGLSRIVKRLTDTGAPPIAGIRHRRIEDPTTGEKHAVPYQPAWGKAYVHKILSGREVLGEYRPDRGGEAQEPIKNYYPAIIEEPMWEKAQAALESRKDKPGPVGARVSNLFGGLLHDAASGSRMLVSMKTEGPKDNHTHRRILRSADSMDGRGPCVSFPYQIFEDEVLLRLREVTTADVIGAKRSSEVATLTDERDATAARIKRIETALGDDEDADIPAVVRTLRKLNDQLVDLTRRLKAAQRRETNSVGEAWGEAQTLLDVARDESHRLRLRALLRNAIDGVWLLVVRRGSRRFLAVQIYFKTGVRRDYLIFYRSGGWGWPSDWKSYSFADVIAPGDFDLRRADHAVQLAELLAILDPTG